MGFSRQEYWSGLPFPSPGDFSDPRIKPSSLASPALAGGLFTTSATWEALEDHRPVETRRLMIMTPEIPPYDLTIHQKNVREGNGTHSSILQNREYGQKYESDIVCHFK